MSKRKIRLEVAQGGDVAYLRLPGHPGGYGSVAKQVRLDSIIENYKGPTIYLDFDRAGAVIGIEFLLD